LGRIRADLAKLSAGLDLATEAAPLFVACAASVEGNGDRYVVAVAQEDLASALQDLEPNADSLPLTAKARAIHQSAEPIDNLAIALTWACEGAALTGARSDR
jgi:hypothetical protein